MVEDGRRRASGGVREEEDGEQASEEDEDEKRGVRLPDGALDHDCHRTAAAAAAAAAILSARERAGRSEGDAPRKCAGSRPGTRSFRCPNGGPCLSSSALLCLFPGTARSAPRHPPLIHTEADSFYKSDVTETRRL